MSHIKLLLLKIKSSLLYTLMIFYKIFLKIIITFYAAAILCSAVDWATTVVQHQQVVL